MTGAGDDRQIANGGHGRRRGRRPAHIPPEALAEAEEASLPAREVQAATERETAAAMSAEVPPPEAKATGDL